MGGLAAAPVDGAQGYRQADPVPRRSFRDPAGAVEDDGVRIRRHVAASHAKAFRRLLDSPWFDARVRAGDIVATTGWSVQAGGAVVVEHPRVEFASYPHEWSPAMLVAAGRLTLSLQRAALAEGWSLKDAAAGNVLFDGARPVFCDHLSFEPMRADLPWIAYGQFVRHFVTPLLAWRSQGRTLRETLGARRDGLPVAELAHRLPRALRWSPSVAMHVTVPAWLERHRPPAVPVVPAEDASAHGVSPEATPGCDAVVVTPAAHPPAGDDVVAGGRPAMGVSSRRGAALALVDGLGHLLDRLDRAPARREGPWSGYASDRPHYTVEALESKRAQVRTWLCDLQPDTVLDVGANTGEFALLAAGQGARVVAIDEDLASVDALFGAAVQHRADVLPLHVDFARASPPTGWRLAETLSFADRACGRFDVVLMLAVLHHLVVRERVPLGALFGEVAACCRQALVLEFVPRDDVRFAQLASVNAELYADWSIERVLAAAQPFFELRERVPLCSSGREMLLLCRRAN